MLSVLLVLHYSTNAQIALFSHGTLVISDTANSTLVSRIFGVDENNSATWLTFAQNKLSHCFCKRVNCWGAFLHTPFILHCPALCIRRPHFEGVAVPTPQCANFAHNLYIFRGFLESHKFMGYIVSRQETKLF